MSIQLYNISITEYELLEKTFEKKASKGLLVESINHMYIKYKKITPKNLHFKFILRDSSPKGFKDITKEKENKIISEYEESGWTFCTKNEFYLIFHGDSNIKTTPKLQDNKSRFDIISKRYLFKDSTFFTFTFFLFVLMILQKDYYFTGMGLYSNIDVFLNLLPVASLIICGSLFIKNLYWYSKNKSSLKKSHTIDCVGKLRHRVIQFMFISVVLPLLSILLLYSIEMRYKPLELIFNLSMAATFILFIILVQYVIRDKNGNAHFFRGLAVYIIYLFIMLLMLFTLKPYFIPRITPTITPASDYQLTASDYQLTASDFYNEYNIDSTQVKSSWSPFVESYVKFTEHFTSNSSKHKFTSIKVTSRFDFMNDKLYLSLLPTRQLSPITGIPSDKALALSMKCDYALGFKLYDSYLILKKDNIIYVFESSSDIPLEDLISVVKSKLSLK